MIYVDMQNRVASYLDRSDLTVQIRGWINDARLDLALKYDFKYLYVESTAATVAGSARYALPTDYLGHLDMWAGSKKLVRIMPREFDELAESHIGDTAAVRILPLEDITDVSSSSIAGPPDYYVDRGMEFDLYPTPAAVYTLTFKYYAQPARWVETDTSNDNQTDYLSNFHFEAIIWGACMRGAIFLDDAPAEQRFTKLYGASIQEMIKRERDFIFKDVHVRFKTPADYDLTTFARMFRVAGGASHPHHGWSRE
jgi:hypothetical protein